MAQRYRRGRRGAFLAFYVVRPMWWPRWLRRLALLTFPLALLFWLAAASLTLLGGLASRAAIPVRRWWTAPRRIDGYGYFEYTPAAPEAPGD